MNTNKWPWDTDAQRRVLADGEQAASCEDEEKEPPADPVGQLQKLVLVPGLWYNFAIEYEGSLVGERQVSQKGGFIAPSTA